MFYYGSAMKLLILNGDGIVNRQHLCVIAFHLCILMHVTRHIRSLLVFVIPFRHHINHHVTASLTRVAPPPTNPNPTIPPTPFYLPTCPAQSQPKQSHHHHSLPQEPPSLPQAPPSLLRESTEPRTAIMLIKYVAFPRKRTNNS